MPTKKGAGGRRQNYDPRTGRYAKSTSLSFDVRKQKKRLSEEEKEKQRLEYLINCAKKKNDKYVLDVLLYIEKHLPHSVVGVNCFRYDPYIKRDRELDIITKHFIVEVKSGAGGRRLSQFMSQKRLAETLNKGYVVFAPEIAKIGKYDYNKNGINVVTTLDSLVEVLKGEKKR